MSYFAPLLVDFIVFLHEVYNECNRIAYTRIFLCLKVEYPAFKDPLIARAFSIGYCAHQGQIRKNGDSFISHGIETAKTLMDLKTSPTTVAAGLLHDVLDDCIEMSEGHLRTLIDGFVSIKIYFKIDAL